MIRFSTASVVALACALLVLPTFAQNATDDVPASWRALSEDGPWVVRIDDVDRATRDALSLRFDVWSIDPAANAVTALVTDYEVRQLAADGLDLSLDHDQTRTLSRLGIPLEGQGSGIPGFPCYRTVEETFATAEGIVAAHPTLASWIDIGDSWDKSQDAADGYDLFVLKLTNAAVSGPKPSFFANFAIHSREYTTAELGTRFAEHLVAGYDVDPNITWLLDHHEVHLLLQSNPDGRKQAEAGAFWRKNVNNDYCANTSDRGADLNRNFGYRWNCCSGSSGSQCSPVYRGPLAASEPEIQAIQSYIASIFPDQRGPNVNDPAPDDATGVAIDVHSSGQLVLWPWGFEGNPTPNGTAFATLGRKIGFLNGYSPLQISDFTIADGDSADHYYGELGIAGFGFELGTNFFQSCSTFESNVVPGNLDALTYAAQVARTPYLTPAGPDPTTVTTSTDPVVPGALVTLTATLDDTRFNNANGTEPTQMIAAAQAFLDSPPWSLGSAPIAMAASDGTFDEAIEQVEVTVDTTGLAPGRHMLFVRGTDTDGNDGVVGATFLTIQDATVFVGDFESGDTTDWTQAVGE